MAGPPTQGGIDYRSGNSDALVPSTHAVSAVCCICTLPAGAVPGLSSH